MKLPLKQSISIVLIFALLTGNLPADAVTDFQHSRGPLITASHDEHSLFTSQAMAVTAVGELHPISPHLSFRQLENQPREGAGIPEFNPEWRNSTLIMAALLGADRIYQNKTLANNPHMSILNHRVRVATLYEELSRRVPGTKVSSQMIAAALLLQTRDADRQGEFRELKKKEADAISSAIHQINAYRWIPYNPAPDTYRTDRPLAERRNVLNHMERLLKTEVSPHGREGHEFTEKTLGLDSLLLAMADKLATMEDSSPDIRQYLRREIHEILAPLCSRMGQPALANFLEERSFFLADLESYRRYEREIDLATHMGATERIRYLEKTQAGMEKFLHRKGFPKARVTARGKFPASVARKIRVKPNVYPTTFDLKDLLGFQIILGTRDIQARNRAVDLIVNEFFKAEKLVDAQTELKRKALKGYDAFYITPLKSIEPEFRSDGADDTPVPHEIQFFPDEAEIYDYYYGPGAWGIYKISGETHQIPDFTPIAIKSDNPYGNFERLKDSLRLWTYYSIPSWEGTERTYIDQRIPRAQDNRGRVIRGNVADVAALNNKLKSDFAGASVQRVSFDSDQPPEERWDYRPTQIRTPDNLIADGDVVTISEGHRTAPLSKAEGSSSLWRTPVMIHRVLHGGDLETSAAGQKALLSRLKESIHFSKLAGGRKARTRGATIGTFDQNNRAYREEVLKPIIEAHSLVDEQELFTLLGLFLAQRHDFGILDMIADATRANGLRVLKSHAIPVSELGADVAQTFGVADLASFILLAGMRRIPEDALRKLSTQIASNRNANHVASSVAPAPSTESPVPGLLEGRFGEVKRQGTLIVSVKNWGDFDREDLQAIIVQILSDLDVEFTGDELAMTETTKGTLEIETDELYIPVNIQLQRVADTLASLLNENYSSLESLRSDSGSNFQCMVGIKGEDPFVSSLLTRKERLRGRWIGGAAGFLAASVSVGLAFGIIAAVPAALLGVLAGYRLIPILSEFWHERVGHAWKAHRLGYRSIEVRSEDGGWAVYGIAKGSPAGTQATLIQDPQVQRTGWVASVIGAILGTLGTGRRRALDFSVAS